jgi:DMATS type aromatic prenyltransferase
MFAGLDGVDGWGSRRAPATPQWPCDIGDDHSPFEFSVAFAGGRPEIRVVVEAQGQRPDFASTRDAGLSLHAALARQGADVEKFERVRDLFLPEHVWHGRFALWHAVTLAPGPLRAKAYLNPQIRGVATAAPLVKEAFERLGMTGAWKSITSALPQLTGKELRYFALDMDGTSAARAKLHVCPPAATARDLERIAALRPAYVQGEVTDFCREMTDSTGPFDSYPVCIYTAFVGSEVVPFDVTIQIPIRHYVANDDVARSRVLRYLERREIDPEPYERALAAAARRPLAQGRGLHSYVSLRTAVTPVRVTTYFAAEAYGVLQPLHSGTVEVAGSVIDAETGQFRANEHSTWTSRRRR